MERLELGADSFHSITEMLFVSFGQLKANVNLVRRAKYLFNAIEGPHQTIWAFVYRCGPTRSLDLH